MVWPLWVPQLQAHMAAADVASVLLLSRSATRGVRVFRMYRLVASVSYPINAEHKQRKTPAG